MYDVVYKCTTREQWYWDSNHSGFNEAVARAQTINRQMGRAVAVTYNDAPVFALDQTREAGVTHPMAVPGLAYLD